MKAYKDVVAEQKVQHTRPAANSVHRSSLVFPVAPVPGSTPVVVLSNHFKIKRDIAAVGMRVWGFNGAGKRVFADHVMLDEPRVYRYDLAERCPAMGELAVAQVEFYAAENLGVPYPAAMVNHVGPGFRNMVHAFARVLNDVFEAEEIASITVAEASIDVRVDELYDTFVCFLTGARPLTDDRLRLSLRLPDGEELEGSAQVATTPFSQTTVFLSKVFPGRTLPLGSVLRVLTPQQPEFFGRMMGGMLSRRDGAFSANHSYYDRTKNLEYVDAKEAYAYYPLHEGRITRLIFYPIQSPSKLKVQAEYFDAAGKSVGVGTSLVHESPTGATVILEASAEAPPEARSFRVSAAPLGESKLPARISLQAVHGKKSLAGSISEALIFAHENVVVNPPGKPFLSWVQGAYGGDVSTHVGLTLASYSDEGGQIAVSVYDERGLHCERSLVLPPHGAAVLTSRDLFGEVSGPDRYFFVYARCETSRVKMSAVIESLGSGHCTAEHNF